jgi:hypothetical protein
LTLDSVRSPRSMESAIDADTGDPNSREWRSELLAEADANALIGLAERCMIG